MRSRETFKNNTRRKQEYAFNSDSLKTSSNIFCHLIQRFDVKWSITCTDATHNANEMMKFANPFGFILLHFMENSNKLSYA